MEQKSSLTAQKSTLDQIADDIEKEMNRELSLIGNIVHESVIVSMNEDDNEIVCSWWPEGRNEDIERKKKQDLIGKDGKGVPGLSSHHEVLERIGGYDSERGNLQPIKGVKVSGHRGYFLTGCGVDLNLAIIRYGLDFLENRKYEKLWTPFFMKREVMAKTAQLEEFDEALYKVVGEAGFVF